MAKILNIVLPLKGQLSSIIELANTLRMRGHEVLFAGMEDTRPIVEPRGFTFVPIYSDQFPQGFMEQWLNGPTSRQSWRSALDFALAERRKMIEHEHFVKELIHGRHRESLQVITSLAPDLILLDPGLHAYWALLAWQSGIRTLYVSTILPMIEDPVTPPFTSLLQPGRDPVSRLKVRLAWQRYFAARQLRRCGLRLLGVPDSIKQIKELARVCNYPLHRLKLRTLLFPQLDLPTLIICPEELEFPEARGRAGIHYIEPAVDPDRPEPPFPWERLEADKQLIFCSLGSVAYNRHFFQQVIDAVATEPGWQLALNIGPHLTPADFARIPTNAILVNGAPQLGLLRQAQVMINHGGINSVRECVYFGVPQVVFPIGFDQPGAAARVLQHGLGVLGDFRRAAPELVRALLAQVLGEAGFRHRAQAMAQAFRTRQEQQSGILLIERFLS